MPTIERLMQLAMTGAELVAAQPLHTHRSVPLGDAAADELMAVLARFRRSPRALQLLAILSISPRGFDDDLLGSELFPAMGADRQKQNRQMAAYALRHILGGKATVRYSRGAYILSPHVERVEHLMCALQAQFVWLALGAEGLIEPPLRRRVIGTLAAGDTAAAARLVVEFGPLEGPTTPPTAV